VFNGFNALTTVTRKLSVSLCVAVRRFLVTEGKSATYIKLNDGTSLSVSNFDVAGETLQKGLRVIYGEAYGVQRGLSFILNDAANKLPSIL
jgi:hypothetical protein